MSRIWPKSIWVGDERGNITLIAALVLPFAALLAGFAIDAAMLQKQDQRLQDIADAAAFSGVVAIETRAAVADNAERYRRVDSAVNATAASMGHSGAGRSIRVDPIKGPEDEPGVKVQLSAPPQLFFQGFYRTRVRTIQAEASAIMQRSAPVCVLALNETAAGAITINETRRVQIQGCGLQSNSDASDALTLIKTELRAAEICNVGGEMKSGRVTITPGVKTGCQPFGDPLRFVNPATPTACDYNNHVVGAGQTVTLAPGGYCGGLRVEAGAQVDLTPGAYIMRDGPLVIESSAQMDGDDVTILLAGTGSFVDMVGLSDFRLAAPRTGPYAGLAIFRKADPADVGAGAVSRIVGTATEGIEGTIYLPNQKLVLRGGAANRNPARYTMLIADTVSVEGRRDVRINFDLQASVVPWAAPTFFSGGVRLIR